MLRKANFSENRQKTAWKMLKDKETLKKVKELLTKEQNNS